MACAAAPNRIRELSRVDSCSIDKKSSSELSEAINSMFRWYREAEACYAYLSDVPHGQRNSAEMKLAFRNSRWFTRAWTLQELLAPKKVKFYDHEWYKIGDKSDLRELISSVTYIDDKFLAGERISNASVAKRMSWASKREATRAEDWAYSLMGMFSVQMPMLYGEGGPNAFLRLPRKILKISDDESIFAWTTDSNKKEGLLAHSPAAFAGSRDIIRASWDHTRSPYSMTNKGLRIELKLFKRSGTTLGTRTSYLAPLNCAREVQKVSKDGTHGGYDYVFQAIRLEGHSQDLSRVGPHELVTFDKSSFTPGNIEPKTMIVYVRQRDSPDEKVNQCWEYACTYPHCPVVRPDATLPPSGEKVTLVTQLLEAAAAADTLDSNGNTLLQLAAERGHEEVVRLLLEADAGREPFFAVVVVDS